MKIRIGKLTIEMSISWNKKKLSEEEILLRDKPYMAEVIKALRDGYKLMAIKIYKDATNAGLKEAKEYIDSLCPKYLNNSVPEGRI